MINYEIHPVANIMPLMSDNEFEALKLDIKKNGIREPIVLFNNKIIDGRNRYKACLEIGIKPVFKEYKGSENDLIDYVISLNLNRRHLTSSQKSCLAVENLEYYENITKKNFSKKISNIRTGKANDNEKTLNTLQTLSKIFAVSERYISDAKKLYNLDKQLFNDVRTGLLTLSKAFQIFAKLQNSKIANTNETPAPANDLTKSELKRINELLHYGMTETKAKEYILSKRKIKKTQLQKNNDHKEIVKFAVSQSVKEKLQTIAKEKNKSMSEILRDILKKLK